MKSGVRTQNKMERTGLKRMPTRDERWMALALREAGKALEKGEVPIGAVLVHEERALARANNFCEKEKDATSHAEILVLRKAAKKVGRWGFMGATLYVTMEPCLMCAGAIHLARVSRVVFGCSDPKAGALGSVYRIHEDGKLNHKVMVMSGVLEEDCKGLLQNFFKRIRGRGEG